MDHRPPDPKVGGPDPLRHATFPPIDPRKRTTCAESKTIWSLSVSKPFETLFSPQHVTNLARLYDDQCDGFLAITDDSACKEALIMTGSHGEKPHILHISLSLQHSDAGTL